jgi:hypothetical protein
MTNFEAVLERLIFRSFALLQNFADALGYGFRACAKRRIRE